MDPENDRLFNRFLCPIDIQNLDSLGLGAVPFDLHTSRFDGLDDLVAVASPRQMHVARDSQTLGILLGVEDCLACITVLTNLCKTMHRIIL